MAKDVEATIAKVAAIGYREVEFAGYYNREPAKLRATLDALKLTAPSTHVGLPDVEAKWNETAATSKTLGIKWVTVASVPGSAFASIDAAKAVAARFNEAGKKARDVGMRFAYHNHNAEFRPIGDTGTFPFDVFAGETDPTLVDFEMDLYWITMAGQDPLKYFAKYPGRFRLVHVKDSAGAPGNEMRDVGSGTIDWKKLFAAKKQAGIEHFIVEHDRPAEAYASITASYSYLSKLDF